MAWWDNFDWAEAIRKGAESSSAMANARANARVNESYLIANQNRDTLNQEQLDMLQRQQGVSLPAGRASNAVRGDILANAQDVQFSGLPERVTNSMGTITGGLRPSMFSPETRELGSQMTREALKQQMAGGPSSAAAAGPTFASYPQAGKLDSVLSTAGTIGSLADLFWPKAKAATLPGTAVGIPGAPAVGGAGAALDTTVGAASGEAAPLWGAADTLSTGGGGGDLEKLLRILQGQEPDVNNMFTAESVTNAERERDQGLWDYLDRIARGFGMGGGGGYNAPTLPSTDRSGYVKPWWTNSAH